MMYLGSPGRLVGVKCPTRQRVAASERFSFQRTLEGRVKAQAVPLQRRVWDVELGQLTTPSEVATLQEFAQGAWGPGPFWFVPADAPVVNMLTPEETRFEEVNRPPLDTPPMWTPDGWAGRSYLNDGNFARIAFEIPVLPGMDVTGSAYVRGHSGNAHVRLQFIDESRNEVARFDSPSADGDVSRRWVTASTPPGAVAASLWVTGTVDQVARPAITWTDQPYEYGDGQGCRKAVVRAMSRDVTKAWDKPNTGRWSSVGFTVQEVG